MKGLEARTTSQLYCAFQYFLKQRKWNINTAAEEQEFWVATMHILNTPHRTQVKFLARGPFLRAFEHAMLVAHQTWTLRKEEDYSKDEVPRGMQWPTFPGPTFGYTREHPLYHEELISYEEWLKTEDREFDDEVDKWNAKAQQRFLGLTKVADLPAIEGPVSGRQHLLEAPPGNGTARRTFEDFSEVDRGH
ncbi:hypothetical protein NA56DRAFT_641069 [Hyaloscypha hepaticicola]|uniref:Uncharacterized protein n=1 Tax=Hyaloscypha hepaticicola TaxID=2082293 RepID=A0A2J6QM75_9HELO|nr:hypothetical protein NA56DRAFT_641069 [Hyaloscypha hepaticicola]